ncbi:MAG: alpha/beta hydrolase family protein [Rhodothermales bacterium]
MRIVLLFACALLWTGGALEGVMAQSPTVQTVAFKSSAVGYTMKYNILLPAGYAANKTRYPVLYLLHGAGSNYTEWPIEDELLDYAQDFPDLLIVMVDAGNSWYANWAAPTDGKPHQWETYVVQEVVGHVEQHFRTIETREGRAIAGFSMGGYGAMMLGLRNPEVFGFIGSLAGQLDYARSSAVGLGQNATRALRRRSRPAALRTSADSVWQHAQAAIGIPGFSSLAERMPEGTLFATPEQAEAHDPFMLIDQVAPEALPYIYLDVGTEDTLHLFAKEMAQHLMARRIPFGYAQRLGQHDGAYVTQALKYVLAAYHEAIQPTP